MLQVVVQCFGISLLYFRSGVYLCIFTVHGLGYLFCVFCVFGFHSVWVGLCFFVFTKSYSLGWHASCFDFTGQGLHGYITSSCFSILFFLVKKLHCIYVSSRCTLFFLLHLSTCWLLQSQTTSPVRRFPVLHHGPVSFRV
ncbi:hypothetical protein BDD12DRAFT_32443 [Trichophaea hybrida]|nr:hypothetical protein BDD12DRAFT_32443 [Trichophaea hybrida]